MAPFYYKLTPESVYAYFAEIARHSPIDLTLYNIPMFASPIDVPTVRRLVAEFPRVVGIKDSSGDLAFMMRLIAAVRPLRPDFSFLTGWEAVLGGQSELSEVLIESLSDRLSVLPLARPITIETFNRNLRGTTMLGMLRQHFDVALLDTGAVDAAGRAGLDTLIACGQLQAALLVRDVRRTSQSDVQALEQRLHAAGVSCLGVAENFCTT